MDSINDIVDSYKVFLEIKHPGHYKSYCKRLNANSESGKAEAIVFSVLRNTVDEITVAEDLSTGGADFLCVLRQRKFVVEVSCLEAESVAFQSGLPNEATASGWFKMISGMLRTKASNKTRQVSGYDMPRLLAITSEHVTADILLGPCGAEALLTSDTKIEVPIGEPIDRVGVVTDLKESVFFRFGNGVVEPARQSISAILLVSILIDRSYIVGVLHPKPRHEFPIGLLPSIPFVRLRKWPPENNSLETEWVISKPRPGNFFHQKIVIRDKELRTR